MKKITLYILIASFLVICDTAFGGILIDATFGGVIPDVSGKFKASKREAEFGGYYFSTLRVWGEPILKGWKPYCEFDYLWSSKNFLIGTDGFVYSGGMGNSFDLGQATATVFGGIARFHEYFDITSNYGAAINESSKATGAVIGCYVRFPFFNKVDAMWGGQIMLREKPLFVGTTELGEEYTLNGVGSMYVLVGGLSLRFGK